MKPIVLLTAVTLAAAPAQAEEEGLSLMERGAQLFFEGLMQEVDPAMRQFEEMLEGMEPALRSFAEGMGPALGELMGQIEDWSVYHPPEILDNGDIILRKKTPQERMLEQQDGSQDIEI